jgi:hypothetical protein
MATPQHRKVERKQLQIKFNMDIKYHCFKHDPNERYIANLPWMIALQKAKNGLSGTSHDGTADTHCLCRPTYKLHNIGAAERSSKESEVWSKVLKQAETQARVRAIQMHLNNITTLAALPLSIKCCDQFQSFNASAALKGLYTDEIERQ